MGMWGWFWTGKGPSGFGRSSTADEVTHGIDAEGLTAIVTGATSGIGQEAARVLAMRGAKVIIPARTLESGYKVKNRIQEQNPDAKLDVMELDLSSFKSVESFANNFSASNKHLNILINNAGIMACPFHLSKDGIELQFATNHLGHFLLTCLLLNKLKTTAKETGVQGRIINVSSRAHKRSDREWLDLGKITDATTYKPLFAYSCSKLANILHANELSRRLQAEGANVTVNSLHPGLIRTNIFRFFNLNAFVLSLSALARPLFKNVAQGASTTCYLALHPNLNGVTGKYFVDCNEAVPIHYARDVELGKRLWEISQDATDKIVRNT